MNNTNGKLVRAIIQGGAVGLTVMALIILWFTIRSSNDLVTNHMNHSTEAINQNTQALIRFEASVSQSADATEELTEVVRDLKSYIK